MGKRVCMVVHEHYPRDFRVRREARALAQAGAEVTIVALRQPDQPAGERFEGMEIVRLPIRRHRGSPLSVYLAEYLAFASLALGRLTRMHLARPFDVVHVHSPPDFLVGAGLPARLKGCKLILDIHDLTPELYASRFRGAGGWAADLLTRAAERGSCRLSDRIITTTEAFKDVLVRRGVPAAKITVVHNCPDPYIFAPPRRRGRRRKRDEFRIVHHGTLLHRYGQDILLDAFSRVLDRIPGACLDIYGDGDLFPRLRRKAATRPLAGRVTLHGEVPQEEIARALQSADLCVVPNRTDPIMELAFPTKLLEALQMGCPVVASATRLVAETFSDGGVLLVPPGDPRVLAGTILYLATDEKARKDLASEGRRQIQRFLWADEKLKLVHLYRELGIPVGDGEGDPAGDSTSQPG